MDMSINKAIYILENGLNIDGSWSKALNIAVGTMRKYKSIEQILDDCDLEAWGSVGKG